MIGPNCLGSVQLPDRYDRTELSRFGSTGTEFGSVQAERSVSTARFGPNGNTSSLSFECQFEQNRT